MPKDLFSARQAAQEGTTRQDTLEYDYLAEPFRNQVILILKGTIGRWERGIPLFGGPSASASNRWWMTLYSEFVREKGLLALAPGSGNPQDQCFSYLTEASTLDTLDLIEFAFKFIDNDIRNADPYVRYEVQSLNLTQPDDAISELNSRFRQHGIGYEFAGGELIKISSRYIHAQVMRPALQLLQDAGAGFSGPLDEFLKAHEHHRKGEPKDAIVWALKAFESTLKAICVARNWPFDAQKDTAKQLLDTIYAKKLVPDYLQQYLGGLRAALESGIPTVRNKTSGHGQGPTPVKVPDHFVAFALHLTASNIVFLIKSHKAMP